MSATAVEVGDADLAGRVRLLRAATFTSTLDRFAVPPLLVAVALELGVSLGRISVIATVNALAYGLSQPLWGLLSDRLGRVRTMRVALVGAAVGGFGSALAPSLATLVLARGVAGGLFAAVIPAALVYVGDSFPAASRQRPLAALISASSMAVALATVGAGVVAQFLSWRVAFAVPAVAALVLAVVLRRLPEPVPPGAVLSLRARLGAVLGERWALLVLGLALVEGAVVLGALTFLAPALQSGGAGAATAGAAVAVYGLGGVVGSALLRRFALRAPVTTLMASGAACVLAGYALVTASVAVAPAALAALAIGVGFGLLHPNLQSWAADVVPGARAATISLFAGALFVGSSVGTAVLAPVADAGRFGVLFGVAAVVMVPLGAVAVAARSRYGRRAVTC